VQSTVRGGKATSAQRVARSLQNVNGARMARNLNSLHCIDSRIDSDPAAPGALWRPALWRPARPAWGGVVKMSQPRRGGGAKAPPVKGSKRSRIAVLVAFLGAPSALGAAACGGTSGRETLPSGNPGASTDATLDDAGDGGAADATTGSVYTGAFDVFIPYADVTLPEASVTSASGGEAGSTGTTASGGIPNCPPFIPVKYVQSADGGPPSVQVVTLGPGVKFDDELPADWTSDGGVTFAADGSVCATYPWWFGSSTADECITNVNSGASGFIVPVLPPCSWAADAGSPTQGSGAINGETRYQVCLDLYTCMITTGCHTRFLQQGLSGPGLGQYANDECFCGYVDGSPYPLDQADCVTAPQGPCRAQFMAAFELQDTAANYINVLMADGLAQAKTPGAFTGIAWPAKVFTAIVKDMMNNEGTQEQDPSPGCPSPVALGIAPPPDDASTE
jgi:hypothetical protein